MHHSPPRVRDDPPRSTLQLQIQRKRHKMRDISSPAEAPFRIRVKNGAVICTWDFKAGPDVKFTDTQIEHLDGPLPKTCYINLTNCPDAESAAAARPATAAAYETQALRAVAEHSDKISMTYVPPGVNHDPADIESLWKRVEGDDDEEGSPHFAVRIITDNLATLSEDVARRPRPYTFHTAWPRCGTERPLPAVAVSITDDLATVTLEPHTAELSDETKAAIVAANRTRVFLDARTLKPADYPQDTLAFLFSNATLVCVMALDCSKPDTEADVEAAHAIFDTRAEDSPWVVRLFNDAPGDWGDFIEKHRPRWQHCLTWPTYDAEPAAG
jgi:hypothetical protein